MSPGDSPTTQGVAAKKPANRRTRRKVAAGTIPPTLPPSVEEAYRKKCIELKRRMAEVEQSNDTFRLRKNRLLRGIRKMRLERSMLLHELGKRMRKNGANGYWDDESPGSSEGPPTPHDKPLRSKRSHRRPAATPPPLQQLQGPHHDHNHIPGAVYPPRNENRREYPFSMVPTPNGGLNMPPARTQAPVNELYPSADSQIPFYLNARDYFIDRAYTNNPDPSMEGIDKEQLAEAGSRAWRGMAIEGIEKWEYSYGHELILWRDAMNKQARETGEAPIGDFRNQRQAEERQLYMRGGYEEELPEEDEGMDVEETAAASGGGFTAVNG